MGGRGGGSGMKKKAGGGGSLNSQQEQVYKNYSEYVDEMEQKIQRSERDLLVYAQRQVDFNKRISNEVSMLDQINRAEFAKTELNKARVEAVKEALKDKANLTNEKMNAIEIEAAKEFASSKVKIPNTFSGKASADFPRTVDMREYISPDGNPYNQTARGGLYSQIKSDWGVAVANNWKRKNDR